MIKFNLLKKSIIEQNRFTLIESVIGQNRFILTLPSSMGINKWYVTPTKRPSVTVNPTEMPFLSTSTFVNGRYKWDPITVTFNDPIGSSTSQAIMEWVRLCAEHVTGRMGFFGYKKNIELEMLDIYGIVIEKWLIEGAFLTDINFGNLDYNRDNATPIICKIHMDSCILMN